MFLEPDNHTDPEEDRAAAIRNLGGMVWLYEKHLLKFKTTYADSHIKICDYLLQGKPGEARILVHSVKGLAGTLGLRQLYYAATDLEQAIITHDPAIKTTLSIYETCLKESFSKSHKK